VGPGVEPGGLEVMTRLFQDGGALLWQSGAAARDEPVHVVHPEADALHVKRGDGTRERRALFDERSGLGGRVRLEERDELVYALARHLAMIRHGDSAYRPRSRLVNSRAEAPRERCYFEGVARRLGRTELDNPAGPLVCVDLNGVLDSYTGWRTPDHWDPPRPGALEFLRALEEHGFAVVVFTTRHASGVRRWLRTHGLLPHVAAITNRKPPAHVFVDDRAVCFRGDFDATLEHVLSFKAHWETASTPPQRADSARSRRTNRSRRHSKRRASSEPASD
jgi:hypothetical protein